MPSVPEFAPASSGYTPWSDDSINAFSSTYQYGGGKPADSGTLVDSIWAIGKGLTSEAKKLTTPDPVVTPPAVVKVDSGVAPWSPASLDVFSKTYQYGGGNTAAPRTVAAPRGQQPSTTFEQGWAAITAAITSIITQFATARQQRAQTAAQRRARVSASSAARGGGDNTTTYLMIGGGALLLFGLIFVATKD